MGLALGFHSPVMIFMGLLEDPTVTFFSVGDRGYHVTDQDGVAHTEPGQGAVFRCVIST